MKGGPGMKKFYEQPELNQMAMVGALSIATLSDPENNVEWNEGEE